MNLSEIVQSYCDTTIIYIDEIMVIRHHDRFFWRAKIFYTYYGKLVAQKTSRYKMVSIQNDQSIRLISLTFYNFFFKDYVYIFLLVFVL